MNINIISHFNGGGICGTLIGIINIFSHETINFKQYQHIKITATKLLENCPHRGFDIKKLTDNVDNYLLLVKKNFNNIFANIIYQKYNLDKYLPPSKLFDNKYLFNNKILNNLRLIANKLKFSDIILNEVEKYRIKFNINSRTLGVHFRLTTMNAEHTNYKYTGYIDYIKKIKEILENTKEIDNIFIISDNHESIKKVLSEDFVKKYKVGYIDNITRFKKEMCNDALFEYENCKNGTFFNEVIIESNLLSKCGYLIHRTSSVSVLAIMLSEHFNKMNTYKLD